MNSPVNRRSFIKNSGILLTGAVFSVQDANLSDPLILRKIPSTGEQIPTIGLGSWLTFDVGTSSSELAPVKSVIQAFYDAGGRVIDSSPMYGRSERAIGEAAAQLGITDKLWLATKVWTTGEERGKQQIENSRTLFRTWPKLLQVHNLQDLKTHLRTLKALKAEGKIKYHGFTHYVNGAHREMAALVKSEKPDFIQINLSIRNTAAEDYLIPTAADQGVAVIINRPFETGALFDAIGKAPLPAWAMDYDIKTWAAYFLKFIISNPDITSTIPATSKENHVRENMEACFGKLPDQAGKKRMQEYFMKQAR